MNHFLLCGIKKTFAVVLSAAMVCAATVVFPVEEQPHVSALIDYARINNTDYIRVGIKGGYYSNIQEALDRINEIRYEACAEGIRDPRNGSSSLTLNDYVPIQWSTELEELARLRAVEASIRVSHTRPNDNDCFSVCPDTVFSSGEVLAWNFSKNMVQGINQFYAEKNAWVNNTGAVTGHYTMMIDPSNTFVGLGGFYSSECGVYPSALCGRFGGASGNVINIDHSTEEAVVPITIAKNNITGAFLKYDGERTSYLKPGDSRKYELWLNVSFDNTETCVKYIGNDVEWSVSDSGGSGSGSDVVRLNDGMVSALSKGNVTITASTSDGYSAQADINVYSPVTEIQFDRTEVTIPEGCSLFCHAVDENWNFLDYESPDAFEPDGNQVLKTLILPMDATDRELTWTSDNPDVAEIRSGYIYASGAGTATVTARAASGVTAAFRINVPETTVSFDQSRMTLSEGETAYYYLNQPGDIVDFWENEQHLFATLSPELTKNRGVSLTSDNESVVRIENNKIIAVSAGRANIKASLNNGNVAVCEITVPKTTISFDRSRMTLVEGEIAYYYLNEPGVIVGHLENEQCLFATLSPELTKNREVSMTSDNESVVRIEDNKIIAVSSGKANITASLNNGSVAVCEVTVPETQVTLSETELTVKKGEYIELAVPDQDESISSTGTIIIAELSPENVKSRDVKWTSDNPSVITIEDDHAIAQTSGKATIKATLDNGNYAVCTVTVISDVTSIKMNQESATIKVGDTLQLDASVEPSDATDKSVIWTSSDESVATVKNGLVTARKSGLTMISAKASNSLKTTCTILVEDVDASDVILSMTSAVVEEGKTVSLTATITPANATNKNLTWTTSDSKVATVSGGTVKAVKAGTATITVKTANSKTASCKVTVKAATVNAGSVKLNKTKLSLAKGKTATLKATIAPANTTNKKLTWTTSNKKVAAVDSKGKVKAVGKGSATITVKTSNGKKSTCKVTVTVPATKVKLSKTKATLKVGKSVTLKATMTPSNSTDKLTWTTSNKKVATVKNGKVTAKKAGTVTITVKTASGKTAKCKVTVKKK